MERKTGRYVAFPLLLCSLLPAMACAAPEAPVLDALKQGGVVILLRHAITDAGTGDPPGFRPDDCSTQRNLSLEGRAQARRFGSMLEAHGIRPQAVKSSRWCRCMDTGSLAFPHTRVQHWPALDSLFMDDSRKTEQTAGLRAAVRRLPAREVSVWVTHNANVTALTDQYVGMGEALVLKPDPTGDFRVIGKLQAPER